MRHEVKGVRKMLAFSAIVFILPITSFAQGGGEGAGLEITNPIGSSTFTQFLGTLLDIIVIIAIPIVILAIIYVGFLFVTAQGNEDKISKAKKAIIWTLLGALLILGARVVATAIEGTVNALDANNSAIILAIEDVQK